MAVTWCDSVRGEIEADIAEKKAKARRGSVDSAPAPAAASPTASPTASVATSNGTFETADPEGMILRTMARLQDKIDVLLSEIGERQAALLRAQNDYIKWSKIAEGLGINITGEMDDDDSEREVTTGEADNGGDLGSDPDPVRDSGVHGSGAGLGGPEDRDAGDSAGADLDD